ncbi:MAG TPA: NAD(P)/FAD-dependent oxidoreductase [Nocardioides sp.]|nr:NAD(P)/FAD-dependent oxidoreductase [Nocardioides sp.]
MTRRDTDVVVVGASTAGLVTALGLARRGLGVVLLDSVPPPRLAWSAIHHWSVLPILDDLGVLDAALVAGEATAHWGLRVLSTGEQLDFDLRELGPEARHPFNLRLEPHLLRAPLRRALAATPGAAVLEGRAVRRMTQTGEEVVLDLSDGTTLGAAWVVGADGPASAIRRMAGLAFEGTTWTERAVVAVIEHDFAAAGYPDTTFQVDGHAGAVVERVGQGTWRYLHQESLALPEEGAPGRLVDVLDRVTGHRPPVLDWASSRMHQRCASSYRNGRVVLIGDAAHLTHPLTGHTSLSGWQDAASLVQVLAAALLRDGGDEPVTRWAEVRRRHFLDDAAPTSLGRRNLVAQIRDRRRLEVELDPFRRASADPELRRELLRVEYGASGR